MAIEIKEKSGAAPDSLDIKHDYLDEMMKALPAVVNGKISRLFMNKCLYDKGGDRPYFRWLFENCAQKENPAGWLVTGMINYYADYLGSTQN